MASTSTPPVGGSEIQYDIINRFDENFDLGKSQDSMDIPTTQEIYDHLQFLKRTWPSLEDMISSPFAPKFYKSRKRIVNKTSYISSEAEKVEHKVRLLETEDDIHHDRTAKLRCLPSCDPARCIWVLIRPTGTFSIVKFKIEKPAGYRKFNEITGEFEDEKIVARAIVRYGRRSSDVDADDFSSSESSEDEHSATYSYDVCRSSMTTATGKGQSSHASANIPAGEHFTGRMSGDYESSSESQNIAKMSKLIDLPNRSTKNDQMVQPPKTNRQPVASSLQKGRPHQPTILRMPQAQMYRPAAPASSRSSQINIGPINTSNNAVRTENSDPSVAKRKASAASDHGNTSGSGVDFVPTKRMKSPDGPSPSGYGGSKGNFVDLCSDESVLPEEDQKPVKIPRSVRSSNETLGINSPSDSSKNFPPSFRSSGTPHESLSPNPSKAITTNATLHDPAVFELQISYGSTVPGVEPEIEVHMWREVSIPKLSKAGLFKKAGIRLPRKVALESLTLSLKLKEERQRPSHSVLIEASDEGDENFSLFKEKWNQFTQAGQLKNNTIRVTPGRRFPDA